LGRTGNSWKNKPVKFEKWGNFATWKGVADYHMEFVGCISSAMPQLPNFVYQKILYVPMHFIGFMKLVKLRSEWALSLLTTYLQSASWISTGDVLPGTSKKTSRDCMVFRNVEALNTDINPNWNDDRKDIPSMLKASFFIDVRYGLFISEYKIAKKENDFSAVNKMELAIATHMLTLIRWSGNKTTFGEITMAKGEFTTSYYDALGTLRASLRNLNRAVTPNAGANGIKSYANLGSSTALTTVTDSLR